jgi:hypothetical protein
MGGRPGAELALPLFSPAPVVITILPQLFDAPVAPSCMAAGRNDGYWLKSINKNRNL